MARRKRRRNPTPFVHHIYVVSRSATPRYREPDPLGAKFCVPDPPPKLGVLKFWPDGTFTDPLPPENC